MDDDWVRALLSKKGYNPGQPRVPAGSPEGGQFAAGGSHEAAVARGHAGAAAMERNVEEEIAYGKEESRLHAGHLAKLKTVPRERMIGVARDMTDEHNDLWVKSVRARGMKPTKALLRNAWRSSFNALLNQAGYWKDHEPQSMAEINAVELEGLRGSRYE